MTKAATPLLTTLVFLLAGAPAASAQPIDAQPIEAQPIEAQIEAQILRVVDSESLRLIAEATRRGFRRFRRSVTLGPTASVGPSVPLDGDASTRTYVSGGLGLLVYDIPVLPTPDDLRSMALAMVKDAVEVQVRAAAARGEVMSEQEVRRLAAEAWQRLKDRLLLGMTPRHLETPKLVATGEVGHLVGIRAWDVRAMLGLGVGPVFVSVGASLLFDRDFALVIPAEVSVPVLLTDGLNSPVVQVFVRGEMPVTGGEDELRRVVIGARVALDVL
jgi:hypothetical protein